MNARHTYLISTLVAFVFLTQGISAALAERHDQSKHAGHTESHASQVHAGASAHGKSEHSAVHPMWRGYQVRAAEPTYCPTVSVSPVHQHPSAVTVARRIAVERVAVNREVGIRIVNPAALGLPASYMLDGQPVFLQSGGMQTLHRPCVIRFDRGRGYGFTQLALTEGTYTVGLAFDGGWSLFHD